MSTIDADAHVVESEHTWDFMDPADQKYRPLIVRPRAEESTEYWLVNGKIRGLIRVVLTAQNLDDIAKRTGRVMSTPRETREMENVPARLRHMDELGIDIQVLYPTMFIELVADKVEWEIAICKGMPRPFSSLTLRNRLRFRRSGSARRKRGGSFFLDRLL